MTKDKKEKKTCSNCKWNDGFDCRNTNPFVSEETWDGVCTGWEPRGRK